MRYFAIKTIGVLVVGLLALGCHHASPLVGKWKEYILVRKPGQSQTTLTFKEDGTFETSTEDWDPLATVNITTICTGTWQYEEPKLILRIDDMTWKFEGEDQEKIKAARAKCEATKQADLFAMNSIPFHTLTWDGEKHAGFNLMEDNASYLRQ